MHTSSKFELVHRFRVPVQKSQTRDKMEIVTIKISQNQNYLAVVVGKFLVKGVKQLWQLMVYSIHSEDEFKLISKHHPEHMLPDQFRYYSKSIEFCEDSQHQHLLLTNRSNIVKFDYTQPKENISVLYKF